MIKVLIVDDHAVVRQGVRNILGLAEDIEVIGEAGSGEELLERLEHLTCNLVLLDITMPGITGAPLIARCRALRPDLPLLVLSMHKDGQVAFGALKAGANGYTTKDRDPRELLTAVYKVARGGRYVDSDLAELIVFETARSHERSPLECLSARELEILRHIAKGLAIGDIAQLLHLSPKTVSTHKIKLMQKLGIDNIADLILLAATYQLNRKS